jgi:hypothetical protein
MAVYLPGCRFAIIADSLGAVGACPLLLIADSQGGRSTEIRNAGQN